MGEFRAGDVANTLYKVALTLQDNGLLLSELVRRITRLERFGLVRHHIIVANAAATTAIALLMYRAYRRNVRGALSRRENRTT